MIFGFSDFSLRVIYEAVERWEDVVEDLASENFGANAAASAGASPLTSAMSDDSKLSATTFPMAKIIALASAVGSDSARDDTQGADDTPDEQKLDHAPSKNLAPLADAACLLDVASLVDLVPLVLPASAASIREPDASAKIEAQQAAPIRRVFTGYEWVARYQAIPSMSMGWQHLVDARREDDRHERDRRATSFARTP
jgi:hypothetical protein